MPLDAGTEADLELVVARTGHERYRVLTADDHPHRDYYRGRVRLLAARLRGGPDPTPMDAEAARRARRASKPRVPLGTPHCLPCKEEEARRLAASG